jgi:hypothetical protein
MSESGRVYFHGPNLDDEESDWLGEFVETVAGQITADGPMGPLKIESYEEDGFWEVVIYPTPVELIGGAQDGEVVIPGFSLDLEGLRVGFESVTAMGWHSLGLPPYEGPYAFIEGVFAGRMVYLQVLAYPPEDEQPGMKLEVKRRRNSDDSAAEP